jgi:hypothetical protein
LSLFLGLQPGFFLGLSPSFVLSFHSRFFHGLQPGNFLGFRSDLLSSKVLDAQPGKRRNLVGRSLFFSSNL